MDRRKFVLGLASLPVVASVPVILASEHVIAKEIDLPLSEQLKKLMIETFHAQVNFEINDKVSRQNYTNSLNHKVKRFVHERKIVDYWVWCNECNNPQSVIDNSEFVARLSYRENLSNSYKTITFTSQINSLKFHDIV